MMKMMVLHKYTPNRLEDISVGDRSFRNTTYIRKYSTESRMRISINSFPDWKIFLRLK